MEEIKDTNRYFSPVEMDLINEFTEIHYGQIKKEVVNSRDYLLMSSEIVSARFSIKKDRYERSIQVVLNSISGYDVHNCNNPSVLKEVLGL